MMLLSTYLLRIISEFVRMLVELVELLVLLIHLVVVVEVNSEMLEG